MAMYIQTNVASLMAQNALSNTQTASQLTFQRLSSGYRINSAADDAAGLGISMSMNAQVQSYSVAQRNANDAISMAQTADGAAGQVADLLTRMRELAVQGSNGTLSSNDSANLQTEFGTLANEIDRIANVAKFNGVTLLAGTTTTVNFQVGINNTTNDRVTVSFGGVDVSNLFSTSASALSISTNATAQAMISTIDTAIQKLATQRENFGAAMNRFQQAVTNLATMNTNLSASLSRIRDVDVAAETANMSKNSVLTQAGTAVLSQANSYSQNVLSLLR